MCKHCNHYPSTWTCFFVACIKCKKKKRYCLLNKEILPSSYGYMHTLWPKWQHFCSWVHPLCIVHPIVDDLTQKKCLFSSVETRPRQHLQMGWCMTMVLCVCVPRGFAKWSIYIIKKFLLKLTFLLEDDLLKFCLNGFDVSFILAEKKR